MKPDTYVINCAINTEGRAATDEQREQALSEANALAIGGYIAAEEITAYAAKFADFLCGNGARP